MRLISSVQQPRMIACMALRSVTPFTVEKGDSSACVPVISSFGSFFALLAFSFFIGADHVVRTGINWSSVFITLPDELLVYSDKGDVGGIEPDGVPAIIQEVQPEVEILGGRAVKHPADVIEVARELAVLSRLVLGNVESVRLKIVDKPQAHRCWGSRRRVLRWLHHGIVHLEVPGQEVGAIDQIRMLVQASEPIETRPVVLQ